MSIQYLPNQKNQGEGLEFLSQLANNSVNLIFLDPQYEPVSSVSRIKDWPLFYQSDYQILRIMEQVERVLKPSAFCLLWVNKTLLGNDRVPLWMLKTPLLKIVDILVWNKTYFGFGSYFRNQVEFGLLIQKHSQNSKKFKNRSLGNVWSENIIPSQKRNHPHQKPKGLIKAIIEATTDKDDLVVDPCAGSFVVLEVCQELEREFMGCDLSYFELGKFKQERERERKFSKLE